MSFYDRAKSGLRNAVNRFAGITHEKALIDELQRLPVYRTIAADHVNRKDRRAAARKQRYRNRNGALIARHPAKFGWAIHADANNKLLHYINHSALHRLFGAARTPIFQESLA